MIGYSSFFLEPSYQDSNASIEEKLVWKLAKKKHQWSLKKRVLESLKINKDFKQSIKEFRLKSRENRLRDALHRLNNYSLQSLDLFAKEVQACRFHNVLLCKRALYAFQMLRNYHQSCLALAQMTRSLNIFQKVFESWKIIHASSKIEDTQICAVFVQERSAKLLQRCFQMLMKNRDEESQQYGIALDFRVRSFKRSMRSVLAAWRNSAIQKRSLRSKGIDVLTYFRQNQIENQVKDCFFAWSHSFMSMKEEKHALKLQTRKVVSVLNDLRLSKALARWHDYQRIFKHSRDLEEFYAKKWREKVKKRIFEVMKDEWKELKRRRKDVEDAEKLFQLHMKKKVAACLISKLTAYRETQRKLEFFAVINRPPVLQNARHIEDQFLLTEGRNKYEQKHHYHEETEEPQLKEGVRVNPRISNVSTQPPLLAQAFPSNVSSLFPPSDDYNNMNLQRDHKRARKLPRPLPSSAETVSVPKRTDAAVARQRASPGHLSTSSSIASSHSDQMWQQQQQQKISNTHRNLRTDDENRTENRREIKSKILLDQNNASSPPRSPAVPPIDTSYELTKINSRLQAIDETLASTLPILQSYPSLQVQQAIAQLQREAVELREKKIKMFSSSSSNSSENNKNDLFLSHAGFPPNLSPNDKFNDAEDSNGVSSIPVPISQNNPLNFSHTSSSSLQFSGTSGQQTNSLHPFAQISSVGGLDVNSHYRPSSTFFGTAYTANPASTNAPMMMFMIPGQLTSANPLHCQNTMINPHNNNNMNAHHGWIQNPTQQIQHQPLLNQQNPPPFIVDQSVVYQNDDYSIGPSRPPSTVLNVHRSSDEQNQNSAMYNFEFPSWMMS
eukprot:GDKK01075960.1.p1 GENE.GDKK01075960.1~~GDKK01075960.1.p1  ORF type:complete len:839 (+),score=180.97 GDKK01075960.1:20-2536(+)